MYNDVDEELDADAEESAAEESCSFPLEEDRFVPLLGPTAAAARGSLIDFFPPVVDSFLAALPAVVLDFLPAIDCAAKTVVDLDFFI